MQGTGTGTGTGGDYGRRRRWSDQFIPEQLQTLGRHYSVDPNGISIATADQDFRGIDAIIPDGTTIGLRVRRAELLVKHPDDFTVRLDRNRDGENELVKLKAGRPDAIFYSHGIGQDDDGTAAQLVRWRLLDAAVFRVASAHWFDGINTNVIERSDAKFATFGFDGFDRYGRFIIAQGGIV